MTSELGAVAAGSSPTHRHLRQRLSALGLLTVAVDVVASLLILLIERDERGSAITNLGDALFWTSTQLLTISSPFPNPLTPAAKVLDVLLQLFAITAVASLAGSFGAFFHRRGHERDAAEAGG